MTTGHPTYDALVDAPNAVVWTMALTGAITELSPSIEAVRGFTVDEAKAQAGDEIHPASSLKVSLAYFERFSVDMLAGRVPEPFHADLEYVKKDGSTVWCEVFAFPVVGEDGSIAALQGVSVPVERPSGTEPDFR